MNKQFGGLVQAEDCGTSVRPRPVTLREKYIMQKADLTQRLADVDAAITALDENPNFESVLNTIGKVRF